MPQHVGVKPTANSRVVEQDLEQYLKTSLNKRR